MYHILECQKKPIKACNVQSYKPHSSTPYEPYPTEAINKDVHKLSKCKLYIKTI